jgi:peptidylprolyl isomerase
MSKSINSGEFFMILAQSGNTVKVHYTGKFSNGVIFDSSLDREPLEFNIGSNQVILGFDKAVTGMKIGEKKTVAFPPDEGYGERTEDLIFEIDKSDLPQDFEPEVGMPLEMMNHEGETMIVNIFEIDGDSVKIDGNHPLAGKHLTFEIELLEINT